MMMTRLKHWGRIAGMLALLTAADTGGGDLGAKELKTDTLGAWQKYEAATEQRIQSELSSEKGFLTRDFLPPAEKEECLKETAAGKVYVRNMRSSGQGREKTAIPHGMVHHWFGSIFVPKAKLANLLTWLQDYNRHQEYFPEVEKSRLLFREGDVFRVFLRLKRKKIVTVYYNTEHRVEYSDHGPGRVSSASHSTRIVQLKNPGTPEEKEEPEGNDSGYLWRLNSYWRFKQERDGVVVECESISLSRSIPPVLSILIKGYVKSIARESLVNTLEAIREGYAEK
jgi:hypothetical protein